MSPWRPLTALAVVIVALGGTMIGTGHHSPKLGIDLAGGTSLTLTAKEPCGKTPSAQDMNTALDIMRKRVNGYGVSEAEGFFLANVGDIDHVGDGAHDLE